MSSWLRWLTDAPLAESIAGDLEEQRRRRAIRSRVAARVWFWRRSIAIAAYLLAERLRIWVADVAAGGLVPHQSVGRDLRHACRSIRRAPWYALTVTSVIALAMSLATTVFAVVDGVLFKPLPYPRTSELVAVESSWTSRPQLLGNITASPSDLVAWRAAAPDVQFTGYSAGGREQLDAGEAVGSVWVAENFFDVLEQHPLIGGFRPEHFAARTETQPVIITYGCWQRRFSGDPSVVGRIVRGDRGSAVEIVGIMPADFLYPSTHGRFVPEALTPLIEIQGANAATDRGRGLMVFGRMPAGASVTALQNRLSAATLELARRFPLRPNERGLGPFDLIRVRPLDDALRSTSRQIFTTVLVTAGALVLLACLNVTGLAAARAQDRWRELTLRRALGGSGGDLVRLLGAENAVIVGLGSAIGVVLSLELVRVVGAFLPETLVLFKPLTIDTRVVAFTALASVASVAVTTMWAARATLSASLRPALAESAGTTRRHRTMGRFALVGAQVALGFVMATGGALLAGSLARVWAEDPGYRVDRTFNLWLGYRVEPTWSMIEGVIEDARRIPGVSAAGGSSLLFLQRAVMGSSFTAPVGAIEVSNVESAGVTSGFFEAMGLTPVAGRLPTERELSTGAPVVVLSERVARDYWHGAPVVGKTLVRKGTSFEIIGVVPDARYLALDIDPDGAIYYPITADAKPGMISLFVRFGDEGSPDLASVLALLSSRYPMVRVRSAQNVAATLGDSVRHRQFQTMIFSAFGLSAIVIVGAGVLGLVAMVTSRRTREVGVRMALGARPSQIASLVVRQELIAVLSGLAAGGLVAAWAVGFVRAYMYKTSVYDPWVWALASAALLAVATTGALLPAVRASHVDPVRALRVE